MICVTIACGTHHRMIDEYRALAADGIKFVELRLDMLRREPQLERLLKNRSTQVLITARRPQDGGSWREPEEKRILLLRNAIAQSVEFVDLEHDIAKQIPRYGKTRRIVSFHNMEKMPEDLDSLYNEMCECDPDAVKIAAMPENIGDVFRMAEFVRRRNSGGGTTGSSGRRIPVIGVCMGEMGILTRILARKFGSPFTFATFSESRIVAPGMLYYKHLRTMYRFDHTDAKTEVYGVIGDPIAHSLSPLIHNMSYIDAKLNCVYLPLKIPPGELHEFVRRAHELGIRGLSVTIPHKVEVLKCLTRTDPAVEEIGACNTIVVDGNERYGYNTDYVAAMLSIEMAFGGQMVKGESPIKHKRALVLGAGGAGKALIYGLMQRGAQVTVTDIDNARATELADMCQCFQVDWEMRHGTPCDVLANCTPIGMHPKVNATPFDRTALKPDMVVFDAVYNPENTLLIKDAREKGCIPVTGVEMFVGQACLQYKLFTGQRASASLMRKYLKNAISAVKE